MVLGAVFILLGFVLLWFLFRYLLVPWDARYMRRQAKRQREALKGRSRILLLILLVGVAHGHAQQACTPGNGVQCTTNLRLWVLPSNYAALSSQFGRPSTAELYGANWRAIDKALGAVATPSFNTLAGGTNPNSLQVSGSFTPTGGGSILATGLAGNPSVGVTNINILGTCIGCPGSGSLPSAPTGQQQVIQVNQSGVAQPVLEANTFIDPVNRHGLDNTGSTHVGASLVALISALPGTNPAPIVLAPGFFNVSDGMTVPCLLSSCGGVVLAGSGRWATTIESDCSVNTDVLKLNNTSSGPTGNNFHGVTIRDLTIKDISGSGACRSLLDLVQQAGFTIENVGVTNAKGKIYSTGTVSIANGSTAVTGAGTTFTAGMCPGLVQVGGYEQECTAVVDATHLTLTTNWQAATVTTQPFAIDYYGNGLMLEAGPPGGFTQYGSVIDLYSTANRACVYAAGTTSGGVSGITLFGQNSQCEVRGSRTADAVGHFWGSHVDTVIDMTPMNNVAFGVILESAHANLIMSRIENDGTTPPVTTCNGGVGLQSCTVAIQMAAGAGSTGYGNVINAPYVYTFGTVIKEVGNNMVDLQVFGLRSVSNPPFAANLVNYNFNGTTGCPGTGSGVQALIQTYDCNHVIVAQTVN